MKTNKNKMKIGLVIIGRVESDRLKRKMLLPIEGKTFIEQVFGFAVGNYDKELVFFATTTNKEDAVLFNLARKRKIKAICGHSTDILKRYQQVARKYKLDGIITWDGDDLFVDKICIDKTKELLLRGYDFIEPKNLPFGTFSYGISVSALNKIISLKDDKDTQGWGRYFRKIPGFKIKTYSFPKYAPIKNIRLTLDYPEDYILIKKVFRFILQAKHGSTLEAIKLYFRKFPKDRLINQRRVEEYDKRFKQKYSKIYLKKHEIY